MRDDSKGLFIGANGRVKLIEDYIMDDMDIADLEKGFSTESKKFLSSLPKRVGKDKRRDRKGVVSTKTYSKEEIKQMELLEEAKRLYEKKDHDAIEQMNYVPKTISYKVIDYLITNSNKFNYYEPMATAAKTKRSSVGAILSKLNQMGLVEKKREGHEVLYKIKIPDSVWSNIHEVRVLWVFLRLREFMRKVQANLKEKKNLAQEPKTEPRPQPQPQPQPQPEAVGNEILDAIKTLQRNKFLVKVDINVRFGWIDQETN